MTLVHRKMLRPSNGQDRSYLVLKSLGTVLIGAGGKAGTCSTAGSRMDQAAKAVPYVDFQNRLTGHLAAGAMANNSDLAACSN